MKKSKLDIRVLLIAAAILIVGVTTFFLITKKDSDKKPVKGVFVKIDAASADKDKTYI